MTAYDLNPTLGRTGDSIPNVPRTQFNLGLNYTRPLVNGWDGVAAADLNLPRPGELLFRLRAATPAGRSSRNIPLSSYTLVNLRVGVLKDLWSVTAFARNLTNKRARDFGDQLLAGSGCAADHSAAHDRLEGHPQVLID